MLRSLNGRAVWRVTLAAAGIMMVTAGARPSPGRFVSPARLPETRLLEKRP